MDRVYLIIVENSFDEEYAVDFALSENEAKLKIENLNERKKIHNEWIRKLCSVNIDEEPSVIKQVIEDNRLSDYSKKNIIHFRDSVKNDYNFKVLNRKNETTL